MADQPPQTLLCARCDREVVDARDSYEVFERMHYVCFHFEFEHDTTQMSGCEAMGCPSSELGGPWSHPKLPIPQQVGRVGKKRSAMSTSSRYRNLTSARLRRRISRRNDSGVDDVPWPVSLRL